MASAFRPVLDTNRVLATSRSESALLQTNRSAPSARGEAALKKLKQKTYAHTLRVQRLLRDADKRGVGRVGHLQFRSAVSQMGIKVDDKTMDRIVRNYGRDHPGMVDYTTFNQNVGKLLASSRGGGVKVKGAATSGPTPFGEGRVEYVKRGGDVRGGIPQTPKLVADLERDFATKSVARTQTLAEAFAARNPRNGTLRRADFVQALRSAGLTVSHDEGVALANRFQLRDRKTGKKSPHLVDLRAFSHAFAQALRLPDPKRDPDLLTAEEVHQRFAAKMYGRFTTAHEAFREFDTDHSGDVSHQEFREKLAGLGLHMSDSEFAKLSDMYDPKGTGCIDHQAFNNVIGEIVQPRAGVHDVDRACTPHLPGWKEAEWAHILAKKEPDLDKLYDKLNTSESGKLRQAEILSSMNGEGIRLIMDRAGSIFERYEKDSDGFITREGFKRRMRELLGQDRTPPEFQPRPTFTGPKYTAEQVNREFGATMYRKFKTVKRAWDLMDADKSGDLDHEEFREFFENLGFGMSQYEFYNFIRRFDPKWTNSVSYADFVKSIGSLIQPNVNEYDAALPDPVPLEEWVAEQLQRAGDKGEAALKKLRDSGDNVDRKEFLDTIAEAGVSLDDNERRRLADTFAQRDITGAVTNTLQVPKFMEVVSKLRKGPDSGERSGRRHGSRLPSITEETKERDPAATFSPRVPRGTARPLGSSRSGSGLPPPTPFGTGRSTGRRSFRGPATDDVEFTPGESKFAPTPRGAAYTPRVSGRLRTPASAASKISDQLRKKLQLDLAGSGAMVVPETPAQTRFARSLRSTAAAGGAGGKAPKPARRVQSMFKDMRSHDPYGTQKMSMAGFKKLIKSYGLNLSAHDIGRLKGEYGDGAHAINYVKLMRDVYGAT